MSYLRHVMEQRRVQAAGLSMHPFDRDHAVGLNMAPTIDFASLTRPAMQSNTLTNSPSVGRRSDFFDEVEMGRIQRSDSLASLSQLQWEAQLAETLTHPPPQVLSEFMLTTAAKRRSVELALNRELWNQTFVIHWHAAKRRRCDEYSRMLQQEQFVQSQRFLQEFDPFVLAPPPSLSASDQMLSSLRSSAGKPMHSSISVSQKTGVLPKFLPPRDPSYHDCHPPSKCSIEPTRPVSIKARPPLLLCLPCDQNNLTGYQQVARKQIQLFEAGLGDIEIAGKGRSRSIAIHQVGIQCRHCAHLPPSQRARGSTIFPSKLEGIYQAAQNMTNGHLAKYCTHVPQEVRTTLEALANRKSLAGSGRGYWSNGAKILGVVENEHGLCFEIQLHASGNA